MRRSVAREEQPTQKSRLLPGAMRNPERVSHVRRIGIYAGTFNPVHAGHITFALQAIAEANLDEVIFLPERQPRFKDEIEHFGHRVAMLNRAVRPHRKLNVLELTDRQFTVKRTIPQLKRRFPSAQLVFLVGSDVLNQLPQWPDVEQLLQISELVVGVRGERSLTVVENQVQGLPAAPQKSLVLRSQVAAASSRQVRSALRRRISAVGCLPSVQRYAAQNWLYVSVISV
jgi:nicotinate-nucleotide adenylyltransferase